MRKGGRVIRLTPGLEPGWRGGGSASHAARSDHERTRSLLTVIASENGGYGMPAAWSALQHGGTALDAVKAGTRAVEDNPDDHTVGYAGHPNIDGTVELDASIMDGTTRRAGAVGGLRGYRHAITVARAVMDSTPHALITGDGAARLAASIGEPADNLLTEEERERWAAGIKDGKADLLSQVRLLTHDPREGAGTVDFVALDAAGHLASAVSTSGWAFKYRAGWPTRPSSGPATTATTGTAPPPAPAGASWPSARPPRTPRCRRWPAAPRPPTRPRPRSATCSTCRPTASCR